MMGPHESAIEHAITYNRELIEIIMVMFQDEQEAKPALQPHQLRIQALENILPKARELDAEASE